MKTSVGPLSGPAASFGACNRSKLPLPLWERAGVRGAGLSIGRGPLTRIALTMLRIAMSNSTSPARGEVEVGSPPDYPSRTRLVLTVSFALFPAIGLVVTVIGAMREHRRRFDSSVEESSALFRSSFPSRASPLHNRQARTASSPQRVRASRIRHAARQWSGFFLSLRWRTRAT